MKISELLNELEKLMWQNGDVDVYSRYSCGCCDSVDEPTLKFNEVQEHEFLDDPVGVFLN